MAAVRHRIATAAECLRSAYSTLEGKAGKEPMWQLLCQAYLTESFLKEKEFGTSSPDHASEPLDPIAQLEAEKLINQSAGWLRMAADELEGRHDPDSVERLMHLARTVIDLGSLVRDDWRRRKFTAILKLPR